jgi:hypothetical protein
MAFVLEKEAWCCVRKTNLQDNIVPHTATPGLARAAVRHWNVKGMGRCGLVQGGGVVKLSVESLMPCTCLPPLQITKRGDLLSVRIRAFAAGMQSLSVRPSVWLAGRPAVRLSVCLYRGIGLPQGFLAVFGCRVWGTDRSAGQGGSKLATVHSSWASICLPACLPVDRPRKRRRSFAHLCVATKRASLSAHPNPKSMAK